ncbi:hypothetical protein [Enterobacter mori]|uniref:hypothetical protein n=1 Tax=Enterobacter mori TaxID=539813 RepID=UPI003B8411F4
MTQENTAPKRLAINLTEDVAFLLMKVQEKHRQNLAAMPHIHAEVASLASIGNAILSNAIKGMDNSTFVVDAPYSGKGTFADVRFSGKEE